MISVGWNAEYYEIIKFLFWEPQHIGKVKANNSNITSEKEALAHVSDMEVSLNHILNIFFCLIPPDYISDLMRLAFGISCHDNFRLIGSFELQEYLPKDPTQPDIFMISQNSCLSIELKTKAKTSAEQVAKYALLHRYHQIKYKRPLGSYLIYVTPGSFASMWKDNITSIDDLMSAAKHFDFESLLHKTQLINLISPTSLKEAVLTTRVTHISYQQLLEFSKTYDAAIKTSIPYASTVKKLLHGIVSEFELRKDLLGLASAANKMLFSLPNLKETKSLVPLFQTTSAQEKKNDPMELLSTKASIRPRSEKSSQIDSSKSIKPSSLMRDDAISLLGLNVDQSFIAKLNKNKIPIDQVQSIIQLIQKLNGTYKVEKGTGQNTPAYLFRHKLAHNKAVFQIDAKGMLWVQPAFKKHFSEDKVASVYGNLKQLTGWKWADHNSTDNPQAPVWSWHDKIDKLADILIQVVQD